MMSSIPHFVFTCSRPLNSGRFGQLRLAARAPPRVFCPKRLREDLLFDLKPPASPINFIHLRCFLFGSSSSYLRITGSTFNQTLLLSLPIMSLFGLGRNQRTFRPKKSAPSGSKGAQLRKHIDATLGSGNLREAVRLPPGEDANEWLAVNTVDFFNQVNLLYGTLTEFCTPENCPTMTAGPKYEYRWADGVQIKKPIEVSAPKYVEYLMDWIEAQLDDESIFPQKLDLLGGTRQMVGAGSCMRASVFSAVSLVECHSAFLTGS
ncbi:Mob1/phocein [Macleaya cordata]|uniref:Mob1/phocein n=2 Tax=Ranunculales TaxID=41768 RepID=A0A200R6T8_MACCD|nr:Mob1/phocein [Macleaya cordata]